MMTPIRIKTLRQSLNLTQSQLAAVIGLAHGSRYIRELEAGTKTPSEPVKRILECIDNNEWPVRYYPPAKSDLGNECALFA